MNLPIGNRRLYAPTRESFVDPRIALGAFRQPHWPDASCVHCWPALIQSTHYDCTGKPCCPVCACNANRRVM